MAPRKQLASFEFYLQKEFDVGESNRSSIMALGCKIDQVHTRTVMTTQSAINANINTAWVHEHRPNKDDIPAP